jgi:hypothetical protein
MAKRKIQKLDTYNKKLKKVLLTKKRGDQHRIMSLQKRPHFESRRTKDNVPNASLGVQCGAVSHFF